MANYCAFDLKVAGRDAAVQDFIRMLKHDPSLPGYGLGRVFSFDALPDTEEHCPDDPSLVSIQGYGDCAWSIQSALMDWKPYTLTDVSENLGLVIEAYSSEPGCQFQEHYLVSKGDVLLEECIDYEEIDATELTDEEILEIAEDHDLTSEQVLSMVNDNGYICFGGYGESYLDFEDLFSYFQVQEIEHSSEKQPDKSFSLDDQISAAQKKAENREDRIAEQKVQSIGSVQTVGTNDIVERN